MHDEPMPTHGVMFTTIEETTRWKQRFPAGHAFFNAFASQVFCTRRATYYDTTVPILREAPLVPSVASGEIHRGFKLQHVLGQGAYGTVWEATDKDGKSVALKF